jgi:hypothetical protein
MNVTNHLKNSAQYAFDAIGNTFSLDNIKANLTAKKLTTVALSAIVVSAAANIPGADAGPVTYAACVAACGSSVFLAPACPFICAPALGPYCP